MSKRSQRERLLARKLPSVPYGILVDAEGAQAARERVEQAQQALRQARLADRDVEAAEREFAEAQAALDGCYEQIVLRALPLDGPVTVEKLIAEHPPTEQQLAKAKAERDEARRRGDPPPDWPAWNDATFRPALLAATAEGDMTAEDWAQVLSTRMSTGEVRSLWAACLAINTMGRAADPVVLPKGWTRTPS